MGLGLVVPSGACGAIYAKDAAELVAVDHLFEVGHLLVEGAALHARWGYACYSAALALGLNGHMRFFGLNVGDPPVEDQVEGSAFGARFC